MTCTDFVLRPIPNDAALTLREQGGAIYVADECPGYPCRQCLQDAQIGEELILVSYDPFTGESPYRSASPIFLHREACVAPALEGELPEQLTRRQLSVRAFDTDELMIDAAVIDGSELRTTMSRFFESSDTHQVHVHNASRGCWAVSANRSD